MIHREIRICAYSLFSATVYVHNFVFVSGSTNFHYAVLYSDQVLNEYVFLLCSNISYQSILFNCNSIIDLKTF